MGQKKTLGGTLESPQRKKILLPSAKKKKKKGGQMRKKEGISSVFEKGGPSWLSL